MDTTETKGSPVGGCLLLAILSRVSYWSTELLCRCWEFPGDFIKCGGFEGKKPQNFQLTGGLIPTEMPIAETPAPSILAGVYREGNAVELSPEQVGGEKGTVCCSISPLLINGPMLKQAVEQLSSSLAQFVWTSCNAHRLMSSICRAAPNACDPPCPKGSLMGSASEQGFSTSNNWFYVN